MIAAPAAEDAIRTILLLAAERGLLEHRFNEEWNARPVRRVGRRYSGSSSASMESCAITSATAADLCTMGTAPA